MTEEKTDILKQLGVKDIAEQNKKKFYKFAIYGRFGTGKTTVLTRDNNALILDINEDGTTVTEAGDVVAIRNYQHLSQIIKHLPQIITQLRENGKEVSIVVIETIQKLRDITMEDILSKKSGKATFNDWGEAAQRIIHMYRYIGKLQEEYQFHFGITGHESLNKEKDDDGSTINPLVTIEAQDQIRKAIVSQSDVLARALIEVDETDGKKAFNYILSAEPSDLFETKLRHPRNITISNFRFKDASVHSLVDAIRNGN